MALSQERKERLREELKGIQTTEERQAIQLSQSQHRMGEKMRSMHTIDATVQESLKIKELLANKKDLDLTDAEGADLVFRANRNQNFFFMNQEKWGGDSEIMKDIKLQLSEYEKQIHERGVLAKTGGELDVDSAASTCGDLIASCERYLARGRSFFFWRWKRYDAVVHLKKRIEKEKKYLESVGSKDFAEKYKEVIESGDSLRTLMNLPAMQAKLGRLKKKQRQDQGEKTKENLSEEYKKIESETQETKETNGTKDPGVLQWEKAIGIPDEIPATIEKFKKKNPKINQESAAHLLRMKHISGEAFRPEMDVAVKEANKNKLYGERKLDSGDIARALAFPMRAVMRDKQGNPVNEAEKEKEEQNKKWAKVLGEANKEEMHKIMMEAIDRFQNIKIPSPKEIKEKGLGWFLENRPAEYQEILMMATTLDNLRNLDPFVKFYYDDHPELFKKHDLATKFSAYCMFWMRRKWGVSQGTNDNDGTFYEAYNQDAVNLDALIDGTLSEFEKEYENYYGKEPVRADVEARLDEYEKKDLYLFHKAYPDQYDQKKYDEINAYKKSELISELEEAKTEKGLGNLADRIYKKYFDDKGLTEPQKKERAQSTRSKIKRQKVLRNQMNRFLNERQMRQAKALKHDLGSEKKGKYIEESNKAELFGNEEHFDKRFVNFAMDWTQVDEDEVHQLIKRFNLEEGDRLFDYVRSAGIYLLELDMKVFEYKSDEEFVSNLQENYLWIRRAESLKEMYTLAKKEKMITSGRLIALSKLEGRLALFDEIRADYDRRIAMINSPYYALISNGDLSGVTADSLREWENRVRKQEPELADFLKNYRLLKENETEFRKGSSATEREKKLSEGPKRAEAERQAEGIRQLHKLDVFPHDGETEEEYRERLREALRKKAKEEVPPVTEETVRTKRPMIGSSIGNLKAGQVVAYENWISDLLADEAKLQENGLSKEEITQLKEMRATSLKARQSLEEFEYIKGLCREWDENALEKPEDNEFVDEETRTILDFVYSCFTKEEEKITVDKSVHLSVEEYYSTSLLNMTGILAQHNLFYTKDAMGLFEKKKTQAKKEAEKEIEKGKKTVLTVGGKEYTFVPEMKSFAEINGKSVDEKDREVLEQKLAEAEDIYMGRRAVEIIRYEAKDNVNTTEFSAYKAVFSQRLEPLKEEILKLVK